MAANTSTPARNIGGASSSPLLHSPSQPQLQGISPFHSQFSVGLSPSLSSTPSTSSAKKVSQKPPARPNAIATAAPFKSTELAPAAKRNKRKLPDKQLPKRVAAVLPESELYTQLLELESRVDAAIARKKIDIQESIKMPPSMQRTLRICVFNTFANQNWRAAEKQSSDAPSWTLKIIGKILEDGPDADSINTMPKSSSLYPKFSSFFKRITIVLDPNLYPENPAVIWENSRSTTQQEGFEIKRKGDTEFNASIRLEMNHVHEKFKLSSALVDVVGTEVETRPRIVSAIWHYVRARKLQNPNDPLFFACDLPLQRVFGEDKMKFAAVLQKILPHLSPPQAIHLEHRIKLSGSNPAGNACYDIEVDVPFSLQKEMLALLANTERHREIDACDEAICTVIKKIHEHRQRQAFFLGFSQSPVEFIDALIASQNRDLKLAAGEASRNPDKERHSDFYKQPWVEDAVISYLNRKLATGNDPPASM